jgi:uncharacterized coiled-coil protein SlyX
MVNQENIDLEFNYLQTSRLLEGHLKKLLKQKEACDESKKNEDPVGQLDYLNRRILELEAIIAGQKEQITQQNCELLEQDKLLEENDKKIIDLLNKKADLENRVFTQCETIKTLCKELEDSYNSRS